MITKVLTSFGMSSNYDPAEFTAEVPFIQQSRLEASLPSIPIALVIIGSLVLIVVVVVIGAVLL